MTYSNGNQYEGDYVEGNKHGMGIYKWADGRIYEGQFINDKR